jgi:preprotein translocase subunit SecG
VWGFTCAFTMWLLGTHTPSPVADTSVSAGPGDEAPGNELVIPPLGGEEEAGEGLPGAGGIGAPGGIGPAADTPDQTPSADLVPATGETDDLVPATGENAEPDGGAEGQAESPASGS